MQHRDPWLDYLQSLHQAHSRSRRYFGSCSRQLVARFSVTDKTEKKRNWVARMKTREEKVWLFGWRMQQSSSRPAFRSFNHRYRKEGWLARTWDRSNWQKIKQRRAGRRSARAPVWRRSAPSPHFSTDRYSARTRRKDSRKPCVRVNVPAKGVRSGRCRI